MGVESGGPTEEQLAAQRTQEEAAQALAEEKARLAKVKQEMNAIPQRGVSKEAQRSGHGGGPKGARGRKS